MPREHKEYRSKARIYVNILASIMKHGGKSMPTRILYGVNLSHNHLMKHLGQLVRLGLVEEEKQDDAVIYKLTDKGRKFLIEFIKIGKFQKPSE